MTHDGITNLGGGQCDAGAGREFWLAQKIQPAETVLDCGGVGQLLTWHKGGVTAIDDLSGFGKGHRIHAPTFHRGDVCDLSRFADDEFDVAVMTEVLEHVPEPWTAMREAGRVAKRVLITVPNEMGWEQPIRFRVSGHLRFPTLDIMALHLRRAGLDGSLGFLEFGAPKWSFIVAEVARAG